jgi:hydrogenase 3 maturation protease
MIQKNNIQVAQYLADLLKSKRRIVFLGVGSPLRADDSVGLYIVSELEKRLKAEPEQEFRFYLGEAAPENFSGEIRHFGPDLVLIFDAAEMDLEPGVITIIEQENIGGISFCTHMLPLKILANYLTACTGCQVTVVGVQPKLLEFAWPLTQEVKAGAEQLIKELLK